MYINPFIAGVSVTIGVEIIILFIAAIVAAVRSVKNDD